MAKELTVREMARMGGIARAKAHSKTEIRAWSKLGGRPHKLTGKSLEHLQEMLAAGKTHSEISKRLGVSLRTVGRAVTRTKPENAVKTM